MERKYLDTLIDSLEALVSENLSHRQVLGEVRDELTYRKTRRAKQLLKEIEAVLAGELSVPDPPPRPDKSENQLDLLGKGSDGNDR